MEANKSNKSTTALEWRTLNLTVIGYTDTWDLFKYQTYLAEELYEGMTLKCPFNHSNFKSPILKQINPNNIVVKHQEKLFTIRRGERVTLDHKWLYSPFADSEDLCVGLLNEAFEYVLDKITWNALLKLQMDSNNERYIIVKLVLLNFSKLNSDESLCQYVQRHLENNNIHIPQEEVQEIICKTRENCSMHRRALEVAIKQIENNNLGGEEVYKNLSNFLFNSI